MGHQQLGKRTGEAVTDRLGRRIVASEPGLDLMLEIAGGQLLNQALQRRFDLRPKRLPVHGSKRRLSFPLAQDRMGDSSIR